VAITNLKLSVDSAIGLASLLTMRRRQNKVWI